MTKKIIVLLVVALFLIGGGFFWWWQKTGDAYRYNKPENFNIQETEKGKIVENKKAGLKITVMEDWIADIWDLAGEGSAHFFSPDTEFYPNGAFKKGSWVFIEILNCDKKNPLLRVKIKCEETQRILSKLLKNSPESKQIDSYKIRNFNQYMAIEKTETREIDDERILGHISIKVPVAGKLYYINGVFVPPDEKKYSQFEKFLQGIMIQ